jgi:capsular exopolysaccharide synthesis family protein
MESGETRNLSDYVGVLRRRIRLIIFVTLLAAGIALAISLARSNVYDASTILQFTDPSTQAGGLIGGTGVIDPFPQNEAGAGAARVTRTDVLSDASQALGGDPTPDQLRSDTSVTVSATNTNNLVTATVSAGTAAKAAREANQLAASVQKLTRADAQNFYEQRAASFPPGPAAGTLRAKLRALAAVAQPVTIVRPAEVPGSPASPKPARDTLIAAFLGLLLGIGIAFVRETLDKRATDAHEVQKRLGLPLVGYVRKESLGMVGMSSNGAGVVSEPDLDAFRILRKSVEVLGTDEELKVVAVASPLSQEGKSTVAFWYAYTSSLVGRRTVLVECDFRRPVIASRLGFDPEPGLSDYLAGEADLQQVLRTIDVPGRGAENLAVIPVGGTVLQPTEMLASKRYQDFLNHLRKVYDRVVIDCAPLLPVGDTLEVLPQVDGVLLCVRLRQTTLDQAAAAKQIVEHQPEKPTGLVITGLTSGSDDDYYGYYSSAGTARTTEGTPA